MSSIATRTSRGQWKNACVAVAVLAVFVALSLAVANIIGSSSHESLAESSEQGNTQLFAPDAARPFYVLLIGSDSRKDTALYTGRAADHAQLDQHSDIMTLMRIDSATHTITQVSIPRDTRMPDADTKINSALVDNDPNQVVLAAEKLLGVDIQGYIMTDFASFPAFIDALGGVTVDVPKTITVSNPSTGGNIKVTAGKNKKLNGDEALALARARKQYDGAPDAYRQLNVRNIEKSIIDKVLNAEDKSAVLQAADELRSASTSNIDYSALVPIVLDFVGHKDEVTFYSCTGPYNGDYRKSDGEWLVDDDPAAWRQIMELVDAGMDPSGVLTQPSF